jgi:hypothetical protein
MSLRGNLGILSWSEPSRVSGLEMAHAFREDRQVGGDDDHDRPTAPVSRNPERGRRPVVEGDSVAAIQKSAV